MKTDLKAGFTLIEIIIVLVIMATLVGTAVLSVVSGIRNATLRDAVRTTIGYVRHARAVALVKQRAVAITFEELADNDSGGFGKSRISLAFSGDAGGEEDVLAVPAKEFPGIHVQASPKEKEVKSKISVFSNVDMLVKKRALTSEDVRKKQAQNDTGGTAVGEDEEFEEELEETTSALVEANGQCEPYVIKIWKDGTEEDTAVIIEVSKFAKPVVKDDER